MTLCVLGFAAIKASPSDMEDQSQLPAPKPCTKTHGCNGMLHWTPLFKALGPQGGPPYRPAWVCDKCGKHDYVKGK